MPEKSIIITAGGVGKRMGADIPKQFLLLKGKPVLMHTIEKFYSYDSAIEIILVLPKNQIDFWKGLCSQHQFKIAHTIVGGGKERFDSVKNGLKYANGALIGVHDAVRPLVAEEVIAATYIAAAKNGASIPITPINESVRELSENGSMAVNRDNYKLVQTPQCFQAHILRSAYETSYQSSFTDDASVVESNGDKIYLVDGNRENIKITTPVDLKIAEILFVGE